MHVQVSTAEEREHDHATIGRELLLDDDSSITYVDEGWDSRVYVVNRGEVVFKFPRSRAVIAQYSHEIAIMRVLEELPITVQTPLVRWVHPDLEYFGYVGVVGQPLSSAIEQLTPTAKTEIGLSVGRFLRVLHATELAGVPTIALEDEVTNYVDGCRRLAPTLRASFDDEEMGVIEAFFVERVPGELRRLGGELVLTHADLGPWNLIAAADGTVGVIDFGDVCRSDPSRDFAGFGDDTIVNAALDGYGADERLRDKAALRIEAFPVIDLPFYLGKHDQAGVDRYVDQIRRTIVNPAGDERSAAPTA
jgi:aminoglycoside phosphotransferase (APT) family kinase protein